MACLNMYNSEFNSHHHHNQCVPMMSPRISFSNDFVDTQQAMNQERGNPRSDSSLVSSDFEFSVTNYNMMSADELFSKGRLLPFKDNNKMHKGTTTLREELLVDEDEEEYQEFSLRPSKGSSSTRWKGFLGLRKSHIGSKKVDKSEGSSDRDVEGRRSELINEGARLNITPQDLFNEGGSSCIDMEIGIQNYG
ncbi:hypothetical protein Lal_00016686 [Lupinus albus]|uniref:Uncharacterized protein n=1 Tax=Lupinus albus TaxID=3870 RepID=A0A6A5MIT3_LUPAL|nr:hypothetical protein Lalb_Chr05g0226601 [Lupinus albus]KAF1872388.1 hypothetical protein Lal_00016686 [Lupinus albus]